MTANSGQHWLQNPSDTAPATLIAEVAQAHDGSLGHGPCVH